jgi:uncharacterized protein
MKKYNFHINGIHCNACVLLVEMELKQIHEIKNIKVSLEDNSLEIEGNFEDISKNEILSEINKILKPHNYEVVLEKAKHHIKWSDFKIAIPISLIFIFTFIFLQKIGIINIITSSNVNYSTAFIIGIVASLSTCMAVVGGLVLSMSATFAKEGEKVKPQIMFHVGRLISFFVLGGVIGLIGASFQISNTFMIILSLLVAFVLLILGINLLDVFPSSKKLQITLPGFIGKKIHNIKNINHTLTPFLIGVVTFFLPCGFTQSMQIYALSTGSFWTGSMVMTFFALGTLPVLALLSFGFMGIHKKAQSGIFFKSAGIVVIFFGIINLINSLVVAGIISPIFNF